MDTSDTSTLFELLPIGAYRCTPDGRPVRANRALSWLNGYAGEAEMLAAVSDIASEWYVDPARRTEFQRLLQRDGQVSDFVSEAYRHKTRERVWIREHAHLVRGADGQALYYEGTIEDITQQRETALALQANERRFRAYTERSQVLTIVCDELGHIAYVSPASRRLLGYDGARLMQTRLTDWVHPNDVAETIAAMARVVGFSNTGEETVARVRHADGEWRHLAVLAHNCLADPAVAGVVLNLRDVSGRTRAEAAVRTVNAELEKRVQQRTRELELARDEAESANRAKSEFLSRMSHELRTPMHAILGFGQLLDAEAPAALGARQRGHVGEILRAGKRLLELIDQLLELARIDTDGPAESADGPASPQRAGTVLYIEDNPVNVLLMQAMLEQQTQLQFLSAPLPEAGIQMAQAQQPDLILLDIQLPGIDGYEVLRRLRECAETRHIPVIAISANAMHSDVERGRAAGFDDYLTKPIEQPLLVAAVRRFMDSEGAATGSGD